MLKLATLAFASVLLLASGCAEHEQRVALQQSCDSGDQKACQQIAQDDANQGALYPAGPNVPVFPSGQNAVSGIGNLGGLSGIGGMK